MQQHKRLQTDSEGAEVMSDDVMFGRRRRSDDIRDWFQCYCRPTRLCQKLCRTTKFEQNRMRL